MVAGAVASIPAVGGGSVVDLTDDTDIELQKAMEASLQDSYFPSEDVGVSALMQQQQQELLQLYKSQQVLVQTAGTGSKPFRPSSDLNHAHQSDNAQQQQLEPAFASWIKPWRANSNTFDSQNDPQEADATADSQADCAKETPLKLTLDLQCSDESTSSAEHSLSPQHKSGANSIPASQLATPTTGAARLSVFGSGQAKQGRQPTVATWPTAAASFAAASANGLFTPSASQASPIRHPDLAFPAQPASPVSTCPMAPAECPASPVKPPGPGSTPNQALPTSLPVKAPTSSPAVNAGIRPSALDQQTAAAIPPSQTSLQISLAPNSDTRRFVGSIQASAAHALKTAALADIATAGLVTSPATSSSHGAFAPNKRRKLGTLEAPPGLLLGSRAKQAKQASQGSKLSRQSRLGASDAKADSEDSDAQSHHDVQGAETGTPISTACTAPLNIAAADPLSACRTDCGTAAEWKPQQGQHDSGGTANEAQRGQDADNASPSAGSPVVSFQTNSTGLADDPDRQWKGKGVLGLSPLLEYAPEQPSTLDHTKPGSWVWWKLEEATWMLAKVKSRFVDWLGLLKSFQVSLEDSGNDVFYTEADKVFMHFYPGSRVNVKGSSVQQGEVLPVESAQFDGVYRVQTDAGPIVHVNYFNLQLLLNPWTECSSWVQDSADSISADSSSEGQAQGLPEGTPALNSPLSALHDRDPAASLRPLDGAGSIQQQSQKQQQQQQNQQQQPATIQAVQADRVSANVNSLSSLVQSVCQQKGLVSQQAALRQSAQSMQSALLQHTFEGVSHAAGGNNTMTMPQSAAPAADASKPSATAAASISQAAAASNPDADIDRGDRHHSAASGHVTGLGKDEGHGCAASKQAAAPFLRRRTKHSVAARKGKLSEHSCGTVADSDKAAVRKQKLSGHSCGTAANSDQSANKSVPHKLAAGSGQKQPATPTSLSQAQMGGNQRVMGNLLPMPKLTTGTGHATDPVSPPQTQGMAVAPVGNATAGDAALARQLADQDFMDCMEQPDGAKEHQTKTFDDDIDVDEYIDWAGTGQKSPSTNVKDSKLASHVHTQAAAAVTPTSKPVAKQKHAASPQRRLSICKRRSSNSAGLVKDSNDKAVIVLDSD